MTPASSPSTPPPTSFTDSSLAMFSELVLVCGRSSGSLAEGKADPLQGYWCERIPRCPRRRPARRKRLSCQRVRNHIACPFLDADWSRGTVRGVKLAVNHNGCFLPIGKHGKLEKQRAFFLMLHHYGSSCAWLGYLRDPYSTLNNYNRMHNLYFKWLQPQYDRRHIITLSGRAGRVSKSAETPKKEQVEK